MSNNLPKISLIILTYNQKKFIAETLQSAIEQDYINLEIIVVDDNSSDGTAEIVLEFANRYPNRIRAFINLQNLGITKNSNRALSVCTGEYIAFMGGDDLLLPHKITRQFEWFQEKPEQLICYHDVEVFDSQTDKKLFLYSSRHLQRNGGYVELMRYNMFCHMISIMVRAEFIPKQGFDVELKISCDHFFLLEMLLKQGLPHSGIGHIEGVYARYRRHDNNITNRVSEYEVKDALKMFEILFQRYPYFKKTLITAKSERLLTFGAKCLLRKEFKTGYKLIILALKTSPAGIVGFLANALYFLKVTFIKKCNV